MLEILATVFLLGMMAAFAVSAVLLNEGAHAGRRRLRRGEAASGPGRVTIPVEEAVEAPANDEIPTDDRRLPVGEFLFGALYLRGSEPLPFSELADAAAGSGISVAQVLTWVERAEAGGLIERLTDDAPDDQPAVRLTEAGVDVARNNRRSGGRTPAVSGSDEAGAARP